MRVTVKDDAGIEVMVFETDGSNATYPHDLSRRAKVIDAFDAELALSIVHRDSADFGSDENG